MHNLRGGMHLSKEESKEASVPAAERTKGPGLGQSRCPGRLLREHAGFLVRNLGKHKASKYVFL